MTKKPHQQISRFVAYTKEIEAGKAIGKSK